MASDLPSRLRDELGRLLAPLAGAATPRGAADLLAALGRPDTSAEVRTELARLAGLAADLAALGDAELASWEGLASLLALSRELMSALRGIEALVSDPDLGAQLEGLGRELIELLVGLYLRAHRPRLLRAASLLTLIDPAEGEPPLPVVVDDGALVRLPWQRDRLRLERLDELIGDPLGTLEAAYLPGGLALGADAHEAGRRIFPALRALARALGLASSYGPFDPAAPPPTPTSPADADFEITEEPLPPEPTTDPPPLPPPDRSLFERTFFPRFELALPGLPAPDGAPTPARLGLAILISSAEHPGGVRGLIVTPAAELAWTEIRGAWQIAMAADGQIPAFVIGPDGVGLAPSGSPIAGARARLSIARLAPPSEPAFRLGAATGTRLELGTLELAIAADVGPALQALELSARAGQAALVVAAGDGDGFLRAVLPAGGVRADFELGVILSSETGLSLEGGLGLAASFPAAVAIGPVRLDSIELAAIAGPGEVRLEATAAVGVRIGPVAARIDGAGLALSVSAPPGGGNLGPVELAAGFRPPSGVGLAIDAGAVRGGGYLEHDPAAGRYRGALALDALGVALSARALLDTRPPAGAYALVAVVTAEFAPVQLGLGFTLQGVGGLIGLHRRVDTDALRAALRGPGLGDVFFAPDPVAHADRLLGDLAAYFPAAHGRHVLGPAAKLGWGTPTLVEGEIALLLEVPAPVRLVLLGSVRAALPTKSKPIIALHVDFVGELDLGRRTAAIDASLRDSTVAGFPITGDLAFRMSWGAPRSFVLSVGGFHSQFRAPPGFPALRRVRISIGADDDPRLDLQGFLALTSNTAQVGAQVELYASAGPLNVKGSLGFEALIERSPFRFRVDLWAGVALRRGSSVLAGVHFDGTLTGPTPYRVAGEACLSLWFVDLCVDFDATFGATEVIELPGRQIWPPLQAALQDPASWSIELPPAAARAVTIGPPVGEPPVPRIDPAAALTVRQQVAPLNRRITRFADAAPEGADTFQITGVKLGAAGAPYEPALEWFAPAQFEQLSGDERLSRPGYEPMIGGVTVAPTAVTAGSAQAAALTYETILIQGPARTRIGDFRPTLAAQLAGIATGGAARAPLRPPPAPPPRVILEEEAFVIASTVDLAPRLDLAPASSRGAAELALAAFLAANPAARGTLQVVPRFEVLP